MLADLDDLDELGRVGVEVDHVAGLLGGRRAAVHRHPDVGLRQRRCVVGAVTCHGDQAPALLLLLDQGHLVLGRGLGEEVVDPRLLGDGTCGEWVVTGDHHGADAHPTHLVETVAHALLDDVLEVDHAERPGRAARLALRDDQGRPTTGGDPVDDGADLLGRVTAVLTNPLHHRRGRTLTDLPAPVEVDTGHPGLRRELDEVGAGQLAGLPLTQPVLTLGEHDDGTSLGGLVRQARELCGAGDVGERDTVDGMELRRLSVAQRDGARLVQQQGVDVAGRLDGAPGHGEHVVLDEAVHAGDADRREERADGGGDQADQQRDQHDERLLGAGVDRERLEGDCGRQEDDGEAGKQDVERDLVGRLLPGGALHEGDHPVDEALAGLGGDLDDDAVGEHLGAAGHRAPVAAGLTDDRGRLTGDR
jgi:hypothetical protein